MPPLPQRNRLCLPAAPQFDYTSFRYEPCTADDRSGDHRQAGNPDRGRLRQRQLEPQQHHARAQHALEREGDARLQHGDGAHGVAPDDTKDQRKDKRAERRDARRKGTAEGGQDWL